MSAGRLYYSESHNIPREFKSFSGMKTFLAKKIQVLTFLVTFFVKKKSNVKIYFGIASSAAASSQRQRCKFGFTSCCHPDEGAIAYLRHAILSTTIILYYTDPVPTEHIFFQGYIPRLSSRQRTDPSRSHCLPIITAPINDLGDFCVKKKPNFLS